MEKLIVLAVIRATLPQRVGFHFFANLMRLIDDNLRLLAHKTFLLVNF